MTARMIVQRTLWIHLVVLLAAVALSGCSTGPSERADVWPTLDALPESPPEDLNTEAPSALLRSGSDGFVYVVGLDDQAQPGAPFVARYSGDWPIRDVSRPTLTTGRLVRTYGDGVGLVHLSYTMPDAEVDELEVNWEQDGVEDNLGKGRAVIDSVGEQRARSVTLSIGSQHGVRDGDFYAILAEPSGSGDVEAQDIQLSRRLTGVCMVQETEENSARCTLWSGSRLHPRVASPQAGQEVIFLEHTFGAAPRQGVIQISATDGGDSAIQEQVAAAMRDYVKSVTESKAGVSTVEAVLDATAEDFYAEADKLDPLGKPQLVIATAVRNVDGEERVFANYTGVGPATGPGMVAAPPEGGVDLGPAGDIDEERLRDMAATVWSAMLVYRGQTSEALIQLHQMLSDPEFGAGPRDPLRWHTRDQYAMRWGALDNYREALWLVLQDEAVAANNNDRTAWLNALGTRVRLYDFLELPSRAVSSARRYLDARQEEKPSPSWRSALAMYGEMLMNDERVDDAMQTVDQLEEACPEGCNGDLTSHVSSIFWAVPEDHADVQRQLLDFIVDHTDEDNPGQVAATRLYQGLMAMRGEDFTQAMIAFLEAERLYEKVNNPSGRARAKYFAFIAELGQGNPQQAFERGREAQELEMELNDYASTALLFERMTALYTNPEFLESPGPYLGAARQILTGAVEANIAQGDFGGASESLLSLGSFMLRLDQGPIAKEALSEAVGYAISFKRFDVAAMAHLYLGVIARQEGDMAVFRDEIEKAQLMAALSDDPMVQEAIEQVLSPDEDEDDVPTQLL